MEAQAAKSAHPLVIVAAIAVTLFSLVGIGAVLGWIPTSTGNQSGATSSVPAPLAQAPGQPEAGAPAAERARPTPKPVAKTAPRHESARTARNEPPAQFAEAAIPPPPPPSAAPLRIICRECGVIESVREITKAGEASGAGAVGGAVLGGVVGHQVGGGRGRDIATVLGAIGGGLAGNQVEKNAKTTTEYRITVRFEDGTTRLFPSATPPTWRPGDKVKVINGVIQANS